MDAHRDGTDEDRLPAEEKDQVTSESATSTAGAETMAASPDSIDESPGKTKPSQQEQYLKDELRMNIAGDRQGSPALSLAAHDTVDKAQRVPPWGGSASHLPTSSAVAARHDDSCGRSAKALPLVRRRPAWGKVEADAGQGVWFDKTILRVGTRVPWGRLHRGRFAKVRSTTVGITAGVDVLRSCNRRGGTRSKTATRHWQT